MGDRSVFGGNSGCEFYLQHRRMMDADGFDRLRGFDAIYLGAIGDLRVPDHQTIDVIVATGRI